MTANHTAKRYARDIQARTKWNYQFCQRLVTTIGYEEVSRVIDDAPDLHGAAFALNEKLRAAARAAALAKVSKETP